MTQHYINIILVSTLALTQAVAAMPGKMLSDAAEGLTPPASPTHQATRFMTLAPDQTPQNDHTESDHARTPTQGAAADDEESDKEKLTPPLYPVPGPPQGDLDVPTTFFSTVHFLHPSQVTDKSGKPSDDKDGQSTRSVEADQGHNPSKSPVPTGAQNQTLIVANGFEVTGIGEQSHTITGNINSGNPITPSQAQLQVIVLAPAISLTLDSQWNIALLALLRIPLRHNQVCQVRSNRSAVKMRRP